LQLNGYTFSGTIDDEPEIQVEAELPEEPLPKKRKTANTTKNCNTNQDIYSKRRYLK
jgi:hypothetical protein